MSASHLLVEAIRTAIVGLRTLASGLEAALNQFSSAASTQVPIHDVEVPEDRVVVPPASPFRAPDPGFVTPPTHRSPDRSSGHLFRSPSDRPAPSVPASDYSNESYHRVADTLTAPPGFCFDLCVRLGGTAREVEFRVKRAWEAGLWARAALDGLVPKPRPTPKIPQKAVVYIIVRAASVDRHTRVSTATEYFRLIPSFASSSSISHSFPSIAEARVYCAGVGIALPDQQ